MAEGTNGMGPAFAEGPDPIVGRIMGAGSNDLQRSIDTLNGTLTRLMARAGGSGGGGGRPPVVFAANAPREPERPSGGGALVLRGHAFPRPISWEDNGDRLPVAQRLPAPRVEENGPHVTYSWGTPQRNAPGNVLSGSQTVARYHSANRQAVSLVKPPQTPPRDLYRRMIPRSAGEDSQPPFLWRNALRNAQRASNRMGKWGGAITKMAVPMDTYSQWAGIANGSTLGPDGTSGRSVNAIRKYMFGSQNRNLTSWAQNVQDARAAAFLASRNSGFTELAPGTNDVINPQFSGYMQNIKDLAILNPTMKASSLAGMVGSMSSARGTYAAQMFGYKPVLGAGGKIDRNALGAFTDSLMQRSFGKTSVAPQNLKASLGENGYLHANIAAYVKSVGGSSEMTTALEDYVTGRNTAAQHGVGGGQFDKLLRQYASGGDAGQAAGEKLRKIGISNTILQSQKNLSAAKSGNVSDLMDHFAPALKDATAALEEFQKMLNHIVNIPGVKSAIGGSLGWGSVMGPAVGSAFGAMAGMRLTAGPMGALGSVMGLRRLRRPTMSGLASARRITGAGASAMARIGGRGALLRGGLWGAGAFGVHELGSDIASNMDEGAGKDAVNIGTSAATGAMIGAGVGSVIPVVGTGVGAALGGALGLAWGVGKKIGRDRTTGSDGVGGGDSSSKKKGGGLYSGSPIGGKSAAGAIEAAIAQVGKPYQWGGTGPDSFDCSGLMKFAYRKIGVNLPRVSQDQMKVGMPVKRKDVRPGDLMFPNPGHVVMYVGGGKIVEAPRTGKDIRVVPVSTYSGYDAIRRVVGAVGSYHTGGEQDADTQKKQSGNAGGDAGSAVLGSDNSGSTEEVDAYQSAISGVHAALANTPMGDSSSKSKNDAGDLASIGNYNWGAINGKYTDVPAPPHWVQTAIRKGMSAAGVEGAKWARGLVTIAYRESGFRKKAVNNWDSNARRGTPSEGMMQVIGPTFKHYRAKSLPNDPFNPAASVAAAANYIESRYGGIGRVQQANPNRPPRGYAVGAWNIPEDHMAMVHKGEMIIEKPKADTIRNALMKDVPRMRKPDETSPGAGTGSGGGVTLHFHDGSIQLHMGGAMSASEARDAAHSFVGALSEDRRLAALGKGL